MTYLNPQEGAVPGGVDDDIQFNDGGSFEGFGSWDGTKFRLDTTEKFNINAQVADDVSLVADSGAVQIGNHLGNHVAFDRNTIQAKSNGTTASTLNIQDLGGSMLFGNAVAITNFDINATNLSLLSNNIVLQNQLDTNTVGTFSMSFSTVSEDFLQADRNGSVRLYYNNTHQAGTIAAGFQSEGDVRLTGDIERFGTGEMLITHVQQGSGNDISILVETTDGGVSQRTFRANADTAANGCFAELLHADVAMARTVAVGAGGLEVNNTVTGAGFERVLTTSDAGGGGPGGSNSQIQYNNGGILDGASIFIYDDTAPASGGGVIQINSLTTTADGFRLLGDQQTSGRTLEVSANNSAKTGEVGYFLQDHASSGAIALAAYQDGTTYAVVGVGQGTGAFTGGGQFTFDSLGGATSGVALAARVTGTSDATDIAVEVSDNVDNLYLFNDFAIEFVDNVTPVFQVTKAGQLNLYKSGGGQLHMGDSASDIIIEHDGTTGSITQLGGAGSLAIQNRVNSQFINIGTDDSGGTFRIGAQIGGATPNVELNYNGNQRFETSNEGITVGRGTYVATSYELSVQNSTGTECYIEILNNGGTNQGAFFGMETADDFAMYNWQGGPILFYTDTTASSGVVRATIQPDGDFEINSGILEILSNQPRLRLIDGNSTVNERTWQLTANTDEFGIQMFNDAITVGATAMSFTRTLNVLNEVNIFAEDMIDLPNAAGIYFADRSDHFNTPAAGRGELWMRTSDDALVYTDPAGTDHDLTAGGGSNITLINTTDMTSGNTFDNTGWPDDVMWFKISFWDVDIGNAAADLTIRLYQGSASLVTSGYDSHCIDIASGGTRGFTAATTHFRVNSGNASSLLRGYFYGSRASDSTDVWVIEGRFYDENNDDTFHVFGELDLTSDLDGIRVQSANVVNFDGGNFSIQYGT